MLFSQPFLFSLPEVLRSIWVGADKLKTGFYQLQFSDRTRYGIEGKFKVYLVTVISFIRGWSEQLIEVVA